MTDYPRNLNKVLEELPEGTLNNVKPGCTSNNLEDLILKSFKASTAKFPSKEKETIVHYTFNQKIYDELMGRKTKKGYKS